MWRTFFGSGVALIVFASGHGAVASCPSIPPGRGLYLIDQRVPYRVFTDPTSVSPLDTLSAWSLGSAIPEFELGNSVFYVAEASSPDLLSRYSGNGLLLDPLPLSFDAGQSGTVVAMEYIYGELYAAVLPAAPGAGETLVIIDVETGWVTSVGSTEIASAGLAFDGSAIFAVDASSSGSSLYNIDQITGASAAIAPIIDAISSDAVMLTGLEFDPNGVLFGIGYPVGDGTSIRLYEIDPTTGTALDNGVLTYAQNPVAAVAVTADSDPGNGRPGCLADMTTSGATLFGQPGWGEYDGVVDIDDLGFYINAWLVGSGICGIDLTSTGATLVGQPGFGVPDGWIDLDDLGYYLGFWLSGCS
ncbi:MAG: GC-type dockerin domain-anchored protein [Planctomycetota bacterium]